jgi:3-(3-hydroxy-phenyl)propionate hydroxylase
VNQPRVIVVGAGPVGVVAALGCAQHGFAVTLLEAQAAVDDSPRAATTHPATLDMIDRVGLIDRFIAEGLVARYFQFWDRPTRTKVVEFDHDVLRNDTKFPYVVQTEQHKLAHMGIARLHDDHGVRVRFNTRVTALRQNAGAATVLADGPGGPEKFRADYVIGADGGRSAVRKALGIAFDGYTFPERFLVLTTRNDFEQMLGCCYRNYFADPREWVNLFKVAGDDGSGRWRAVFPTGADESDEDALGDRSIHARLQGITPTAEPYDVIHRNLYKVHQRVAAAFRKGRVFLAGDSAHVNNPIGGLGLNCGIHDAIEVVDTLHLASSAGADTTLLDRYERRRRALTIEFVQQATIANKKRLEERDPHVRQANLDELRATADDPARHRAFLLRTSLIESVRKAGSIA